MGKSQKLWKRAKNIIPGGSGLLSMRAEIFLPEKWPAYFRKAKGVEVWDLDGRKYVDMAYLGGVGACILGYADPDVNRAVSRVIENGSIATLNAPEEVELAELLLKLHPWAGMVRYARTGGEAMAVAVRIARAFTGRDKIAFCGYHGWHDWYLAANLADNKNLDGHLLPGLEPKGVPRALKGTSLPFHYNRIEELERIAKKHKGELAAIVVEPLRHQEPRNNFLEDIRKIASRVEAVLIFDEISIGWRLNVGGAHLVYGVNPDIAVFAKAISNGYPMAAIIGRKRVMNAAQESFISSTYWTERIGPAAAIATIKKLRAKNVPAHLDKLGAAIQAGWEELAAKHGLLLTILGPNPIPNLSFNYSNSQAVRTLFTQEMLKRGFLATSSVYLSWAHKPEHVKKYLEASDKVFTIISEALKAKRVEKLLEGPVAHSGFTRLT
ncbi:MAG: aminotransferase class III-fold pyridoxal phosphate-dependent enzyme [bacterium]|nr:aminotransferase class III-fold pyridoxal phosphate-dependent enzyme [bacterium]